MSTTSSTKPAGPGFVPMARAMTIRASAAILVVTLALVGVFYVISAAAQQRSAALYANAKAQAVAQSMDVFDISMRQFAESAYGLFRAQFAATLELTDPAEGILSSNGGRINEKLAEVDSFSRDFPGGNATVFVAQGEDFRRVTTSVKKENGERAIGTLLDRKSPAYAALSAGKRYVGRVTLFGKPFMTLYDPVRNQAGKVVGVLYIGLDISKQQALFAETVSSSRVFDTGGLYVVQTGSEPAAATLVLHPSAAGKKLADVLPAAQAADWATRLAGADNFWLEDAPAVLSADGKRHFASVAKITSTGWLVVAEMPRAEAMAGLVRQLAWLAGVIAAVAVLLGAGLIISIRRTMQPLSALSVKVEAMGKGDFTQAFASTRRDELGVITRAIEAMRLSLAHVVGNVRQATDTIATASGEIASGNLDLSSRTEQQASSLQQTAASMTQLTATVRKNADNAREASTLATSACDIASRGGNMVSQVVGTMGSINASSRKIADIIGVIDGIAFQTNILALNAAVEAARAGEQGRGFAVVASEVRSLAQRSAAAAREIKELITDSVDKVQTGSNQVDEAGRTMGEIVEGIQRVSAIIASITTASQEQSEGIHQVSEAITQMDQVTQQNAALVEEAAAATGSLQQQAGSLVETVSVFRLAPAH
ncbi:methyl-accepting chemotaxis protein [uncultured Ramlibacter sp.]|uniref:methyl-accepting chemotaxis protein n=1 Tax=uncultured Ramlibacter sp. TaxID=260755 RepID=UPI00261DB08F|nr:methyl-accepting chemotaxis protein [uncultured Ramlibacter sp.]